eukprot:TRINITY_DN32745_c0_g1_i2.p3 TRINITY_DN32745_c0_g1~~TRINITY_DN32745_c0_g1_i2.p3  ORF type:complete len:126 (+),score=7.53 TRINITY_DN32745_c0_g1_i2:218-595(+)
MIVFHVMHGMVTLQDLLYVQIILKLLFIVKMVQILKQNILQKNMTNLLLVLIGQQILIVLLPVVKIEMLMYGNLIMVHGNLLLQFLELIELQQMQNGVQMRPASAEEPHKEQYKQSESNNKNEKW